MNSFFEFEIRLCSDWLVPVMVHRVDGWNKEVIGIKFERSPEALTIFAFVQIFGVGGATLAAVVCQLVHSARNWRLLDSSHSGIVFVLGANLIVSQNLLAKILEAFWTHVFHFVFISHIHVEVPGWSVISICRLQIESVSLKVNW